MTFEQLMTSEEFRRNVQIAVTEYALVVKAETPKTALVRRRHAEADEFLMVPSIATDHWMQVLAARLRNANPNSLPGLNNITTEVTAIWNAVAAVGPDDLP